jgi:fermentation-respiration switch protein FrsA (DUF1100 family)
MRKWLWRVAFAVLAIYLAGSVALGVFLAELALHPGRRVMSADAEQRARARVAAVGGRLDKVEITTRDRVVLRGWQFSPGSGAWNGNSVLALHGVGDNRESQVPMAVRLVARGYTVVTPDARGSGISDGAYATYGVIEREDIREWVWWLRKRQADGCIHGLGGSMGAAQLLQTLDLDPAPFCDVVAESPFESFREVAYDRVGQRVGTGPWLGRTVLRPAIEIGFLSAWLRTGINLTDANPRRVLLRWESRTPVLLIHGLADRNIPPRHSQDLAAANPDHVVAWFIPGGGHVAAWSAAPVEYPARVLAFFASHEPHELGSRDAAVAVGGDVERGGAGERAVGEDRAPRESAGPHRR